MMTFSEKQAPKVVRVRRSHGTRGETPKPNGDGTHIPNPTPDPFDPASLRLGQSFADVGAVQKLLLTVPVRKPGKHEFIRVHKSPEYRVTPIGLIELKEDREVYLVAPAMSAALAAEISPCSLVTAITRQGVVFLWPIKLPAPDGRVNRWHQSAAEAAMIAEDHWIRVLANMNLGAYETFQATGVIPEPVWPSTSFRELLSIGFKDRVVDGPGHPLLSRLLGR
jgi:hypothetical protein